MYSVHLYSLPPCERFVLDSLVLLLSCSSCARVAYLLAFFSVQHLGKIVYENKYFNVLIDNIETCSNIESFIMIISGTTYISSHLVLSYSSWPSFQEVGRSRKNT